MSAGLYQHDDGRLAIIAPATPTAAAQGELFMESYLAFMVEPYMKLQTLLREAKDKGAGPMRAEDGTPWKTSRALWSLRGWRPVAPEAVMLRPEHAQPDDLYEDGPCEDLEEAL